MVRKEYINYSNKFLRQIVNVVLMGGAGCTSQPRPKGEKRKQYKLSAGQPS